MPIIDVNAATLAVDWTETSVNDDAAKSLITDLAFTEVFYAVDGGPQVLAAKVPASSPQGGGRMTTAIVVPAPASIRTFIRVWLVEVDSAGNPGPLSPLQDIVIDRVAPGVVTDFTIA